MDKNYNFRTFVQSMKRIKVAHKLIMYGMDGCINCAFLLPLLSLADRENLFEEVEVFHYKSKEEYKKEAIKVLESFNLNTKNIPTPLILIEKKDKEIKYLVKPEIVFECGIELMDSLNAMGDEAVIQYMDGEFDLTILFVNLLIKMSSNIILPPKKKEST